MDAIKEYAQNMTVQIIAGCILIVAILLIAFRAERSSSPTTNNPDFEEVGVETGQVDFIQGDNGVIVRNQEPGNRVVVSQVVLEQPAWVAVADDVNGQPGRILGAQLFNAGKSSGAVDLLRATEPGKSYIAIIRTDAGILHTFEMDADLPLLDDGEIIVSRFKVSISK